MRSRVNGGIIGSYQTPNSSLTSTNRSAGEAALLTTGGVWPGSTISNPNLPPTITSVVITDSNYNALDDTAVNTAGGYMRILGTNFAQNPQLYFNGTLIANSWVSSSEVRVQLPANSAGTGITFMLFNTTTSGGTIYTTGRTYSGVPSVTNSTPISLTNTSISVQFVGSGDSPFVFSSTNAPSGTTLSSSGLLTGTLAEGTYSFTVTVDDAQLQTTTQSYSLTVSLADVYWNTVGLALVPNPTVTGNTFITDSSLNNADLTVFGDTRASPYTPYQTGYYSNYFDGSGDYLSIANTANHDFGTGDFTVEFWLYAISMPNTAGIVGKKTGDATNGWQIYHNTSVANGKITARLSQGLDFSSSTSFTLNTWEYWAVTRSGTTVRWFRNGVLDNTGTNSANLSDSTTTNIGYSQTWGGYYTGYISNLRVVKGTALYTATYTSSTTPLVAVSGTQLLTCQSNRLIDNSLNNFAITKNGDTSVVPTHPFTSRYDYGTPYYSTYFDGTGDYLTVSSTANAAFGFGTADFTVEGWFYATADNATDFMIDFRGGVATAPAIFLYTSNQLALYYNGSIVYQPSSLTFVTGQWNHVALVRASNVTKFYLNGTGASTTYTDNNNYPSAACIVGTDSLAGGSSYWTGYISNLRIVKGTAVYTGNFTAPTSPLTAISGTSLLTCQDGTLIDNSTNAFAITSSGQAQPRPVSPFTTTTYSAVSTVLPTYGSGYFDGNSDYLTLSTNTALDLYGVSWTAECWVNPTGDYSTYRTIFAKRVSASSTTSYEGYLRITSGVISFWNGTTNYESSTTLTANAWSHCAWVYTGTTLIIYVNGLQVYSSAVSLGVNNVEPLVIGGARGLTEWFAGYLSNFRIVKGTALYTANFYPVLTPLTNTSATQLLTLQYNGASNTSQIRDASNFQNLITRAGNANQGTFAPFRTPGHWSVYFDGTSDYLSFATTTPMVMGTSVFTMEAWVYPTSYGHSFYIIESRVGNGAGTGTYSFYIGTSGQLLFDRIDGSGNIITTANSAIPLNAWTHVAVVRNSSNVWYLYVNGVSSGTTAPTNTYNLSSTNTTYIGYNDDTNLWSAYGYISNLRVVKGTAVYTSNFTPSTTPLRWITNTSLLTCQDSSFIDNGNNLTLTRSGDTKILPTSPFTIGTYTPTSYSVYFDGTGDYLSTTLTAQSPGTGNFTYECWFYITSLASGRGIMNTRSADTTDGFDFAVGTDGALSASYSFTSLYASSAGIVTINTWYHLAIVRTLGTTITVYLNGTSRGNFTAGGSTNFTSTTLFIGATALGNVPMLGYISNFRYIKGTALYTTTFTPSTTPLTAESGTQLLTCQGTSVTDNSSNAFTVTANGNAVPARHNPFGQTDTTAATAWTPATNGGSVYFDGTGDYLTAPSNPAFAMGTGSFTWEAWIYPINYSAYRQILSTRTTNNSVTTAGSLSTTITSGVFNWYTSTFIINASTAPALNSWSHVALVRNGTAMAIYHNGVNVGTATNSDNLTLQVFTIGANNDGTEPWLGYISNVRVTKGTALYTTSFVPSTTPVTSTAATTLLMDANPSVTDWSMNNNLETVGDAKLAIQTPYAGSYYSNYFDGTGDYLTIPVNAANSVGTGDFTLECWAYPTALSGSINKPLITQGVNSGYTFYLNTTNNLVLGNYGVVAALVTSSSTVSTGSWYHLAATRSGTSLKLFINGTVVGTATDSTNFAPATNSLFLGGNGNYTTDVFSGYISNIRVVKGQALYTAAFTPSTTPLTTTSQSATASNVSLLTCQSSTFKDNSSNAFTITKNGDTAVKVQNPFSRVTDYSVYFDGTGDYLTTPNNTSVQLVDGAFTIEAWVYPISLPSAGNFKTLWAQRANTAGFGGACIVIDSAGNYLMYVSNAGATNWDLSGSSTGFTASLNQWQHLAFVRTGNSLNLYKNGTIGTTQTKTGIVGTSGSLTVMAGAADGSQAVDGYITELRISKYARYTTTFTPNTTSDQFKVR